MPDLAFEIEAPFVVSLPLTVESHGWVRLSPWRWDAGNGVLSRAERGPSGQVLRVQVSQSSPRAIAVEVESDDETPSVPNVRDIAHRWLSLGWSPNGAIEAAERLDPAIADLLRSGGGRMLRCSTFYEDFIKTVCTIQISWAGTRRMVDALVGLSEDGLFPTPGEVLRVGEAGLRSDVKLGFRAPVVVDATRTLLKEGLIDERGRGDEDRLSYESLIRLRGIGPYAASHLAVLLHDFSRVPVDSEVAKYCKERFDIEPPEIESYFHGWGEYRFLGYSLGRAASAT